MEDTKTHPSFGQIQFSRLGGNSGPLYGSALHEHGAVIRMTVARSQRSHELNSDWHFPKGQPLIEVDLSSAQFAELLTTLNFGTGVPCTIRRTEMDGNIPRPSAQDARSTAHRLYTDLKEGLADPNEQVRGFIKAARALVDEGKFGKAKVARLASLLHSADSYMETNQKYWLDQFMSAAQQTMTSAKAEVEAFASLCLHKAGLAHLKEQVPPVNLLGTDE